MREKKYNFYELDPRYFKDNSGNGIGDLLGLASKFDYFKYLGVDAIILKNFAAIDSLKNVDSNFTSVAPEIGTNEDLIKVMSLAKSSNIKVLIDIPIGYIKENHDWFKSAKSETNQEYKDVVEFKGEKPNDDGNYGFAEENKKYLDQDKDTMEIPLNWSSEKVSQKFLEVIRYWINLGVSGFVFKDFEYLNDAAKTELMSASTLKELRKFYRGIKEINDQLLVVGRSLKIGLKSIDHYTSGPTKVFDYFLPENIAENGAHPKFGHDLIGKFSIKKLAKDIKTMANNPHNILTFNTEHIGKAVSRWGNDIQYVEETAKSLSLLLQMSGSSSIIYQGQELGSTNIGLTHLDDFQDQTIAERKRDIMASKVSEIEFMEAQVLQGSINARSLMAWDDSKDGGFSHAEKTITPPSSNHKLINVKNQYPYKNSVLNFNKELLRLCNQENYLDVIKTGRISVSVTAHGMIKYSLKDAKKQRELILFVNLTDKTKSIKKLKEGRVILSSYPNKDYSELPSSLDAYESILIADLKSDLFGELNSVKLSETKDNIRLERESQKIAKLKAGEETEQKEKKAKSVEAKELSKTAKLKRSQAEKEAKARAIEEQIAKAQQEEAAMALRARNAQKGNSSQRQEAVKKELDQFKNETIQEAVKVSNEIKNDEIDPKKGREAIEKLKDITEKADAQELALDQNTTDISAQESSEIVKEISKTKVKPNVKNNIISEDSNHEYNVHEAIDKEDDDEVQRAKIEAEVERHYSDSYKDDYTRLREEELAKTVLLEDDYDIDDLFDETSK